MTAGIILNISIIFVFKYLNFAVDNMNAIFGMSISIPTIALPIGISFFIFQSLSYLVDVYRGKSEVQKNLLNVGLYISFFPQLIAGPIVRYETISHQIDYRKETFDDFAEGVSRFIIGLAKKVIISNNIALVADAAFDLLESGTFMETEAELTAGMAWIGALAYTFQIYFDFSGYSDMAIGLGRMFGFKFLENFNYPYISRSVTEFWRRWHISLGVWFRDYLYIPLGGNRVVKSRHIFNLFTVWLCTGIWHGANWTFIAWGLLYFVFQCFEKRTGLDKDSNKPVREILRYVYTALVVIIGWVIFRADSLSEAFAYIAKMFIWNGDVFFGDAALFSFREYGVYFLMAVICSFPVIPRLKKLFKAGSKSMGFINAAAAIGLMALFVLSMSYLVKGSYNPFIYFNF